MSLALEKIETALDKARRNAGGFEEFKQAKNTIVQFLEKTPPTKQNQHLIKKAQTHLRTMILGSADGPGLYSTPSMQSIPLAHDILTIAKKVDVQQRHFDRWLKAHLQKNSTEKVNVNRN